MRDNILIDTNIYIYAETIDDPQKHAISVEFIEKLKSEANVFISIQNISEFSNNMTKKSDLNSSSINEIISSYQEVFSPVFFSIETIKEANKIVRDFNIHYYDALLTATMRENFITTIVTENEKDFKKIPWLKVINPFKK